MSDPSLSTSNDERVWQHRCSDGVGGCTAISQSYLDALVAERDDIKGRLSMYEDDSCPTYRDLVAERDRLREENRDLRKELFASQQARP